MSTNFYFLTDQHIGKRSMAGKFCRLCGVTLANKAVDHMTGQTVYGLNAVHQASAEVMINCPICGKDNTRNMCSFNWAISPAEFDLLVTEYRQSHTKIIKDEYGREYSFYEFYDEVILPVANHRYNSVHKDFS